MFRNNRQDLLGEREKTLKVTGAEDDVVLITDHTNVKILPEQFVNDSLHGRRRIGNAERNAGETEDSKAWDAKGSLVTVLHSDQNLMIRLGKVELHKVLGVLQNRPGMGKRRVWVLDRRFVDQFVELLIIVHKARCFSGDANGMNTTIPNGSIIEWTFDYSVLEAFGDEFAKIR